MKRQKVHIDAADQTYQTESDSNEKVFFPGCFNAIELYYSKRIFTDLQPLRSHTHGHINSAYFLFLI